MGRVELSPPVGLIDGDPDLGDGDGERTGSGGERSWKDWADGGKEECLEVLFEGETVGRDGRVEGWKVGGCNEIASLSQIYR